MLRKTVSGIMPTLLLIGILSSAFDIRPLKPNVTMYIRADGTTDPPTVPIRRDGNVYMFTSDIHGSIIVERDNIVIEGAGYPVGGTGSETGIRLSDRENVTIKNVEIKVCFIGILLERSSTCNICGNSIFFCHDGIVAVSSSNNGISGNNITANDGDGIKVYYSSNSNRIYRNNITANTYDSITLSGSSNNSIFGNNMINGGLGILLVGSSGNSIYHNNFVNNTFQAHTYMDSANVWNDGRCSGGNYWSDYGGTEFDEYGIGNAPYVIDGNNTDYCPLMSPYVLGDVNHDAKINIADMYIIAKAFETRIGEANWNPHADIDENGKINIIDMYKAAIEFGKEWTYP